MLNLYWNKCKGDVWCKLNTVNLDHRHFNNMNGVYIIWHGGQDAATVRVGQGFIRDRIADHRDDQQVQQYTNLTLYVTWAAVENQYQDGVERYLADRLDPKVGVRHPNVQPISVNLPW